MTKSNTTEVMTSGEHPIATFLNTVAEGFRPDYSRDRGEMAKGLKNKSSYLRSEMHVWGNDLTEVAWQVQNSSEITEDTVRVMSTLVTMQGAFIDILEALDNLDHCIKHKAGSFMVTKESV